MTTLATKAAAAAKAQWARQPQPIVHINLPFPPSINALWRHGGLTGVYRSPRYMQWLTVAGHELNRQKPGCISGDYRIRLTLGRHDRRRRDADNFLKAVSDLLVTHGVIDDDSLAQTITIAWSDRIEGCRITLKAVQSLSHRQAGKAA